MKRDQFKTAFFDQSRNLFWVVGPDYKLKEANKAYFTLANINAGEEQHLDQTVLTEALSEAEIKKWREYYNRALQGEYFETEEHFYNPGSKRLEHIQVTFQPLRQEAEEVLAVACFSKDITNLVKRREDANQMMDASLDVFCTINQQGDFVYISAAAKHHWGYAPEELVGKPFRDLILEEDLEKSNLIAERIYNGEKVKDFINRYQKKNGGIAYNLWSATLDPSTNLVHCVARDAEERTKQEEKIQQSEQRLKSLVQGAFDLIGVIDQEGNYTYMAPSSLALSGIPPEEFIGKNAFEYIHPDDKERVLGSLNEVRNKARVNVEPFRAKNHLNEWRWLESVLTNLLHDPAVNGIVVNTRDITDLIEEKRRQKLLESVVTNTKDAVLITEAESIDESGPRIIYVNEAFTKMTGYQPEEVIGKTPRILQGPKSNTKDLAKLSKAIGNWETHEITTINYKKNGEEFWVNFTVSPVADEKGWYTHWIAIERDVTAQKNKELENKLLAEISLSFANQSSLLDASKQLCEIISAFGGFDWVEVWSSNFDNTRMQLLNYYLAVPEDEVFYDYKPSLNQFLIKDGLEGRLWSKKKQIIWGKEDIQKKFLRKGAAFKIGLNAILGSPLIVDGEIIGLIKVGSKAGTSPLHSFAPLLKNLESIISSELKRKMLENDLSHTFNAIPDIISVLDFKGKMLKINKAGSELLSSNFEHANAKSLNDFVSASDYKIFREKVKQHSKLGETFKFESKVLSKSGGPIWLSWYCSPVSEEGLVYTTAKDITQEKNLRELNSQVNKLAKIGSWEVDLETESVYWSEEIHQMHETDSSTYTPNLEEGINFYREDFREMVESTIRNTISTGEAYDFEAVIITKNKTELWVRSIGNAEFKEGRCVRLYGGFQDINDRKESENRLISLAQNLPGIVYEYYIYPDGSDALKNIRGKVEELWGFSPSELINDIGLAWRQIEAAGELEEVQKTIRQAVETKSRWQSPIKYIMPTTGELHTHLGFGTPSFLADGTIVFNSIILDITEQQKAKDDKARFHETLENSLNEIYMFDSETLKFSYVNKGAANNLGYTYEELGKLSPLDLKPEFSPERFNQLIAPLLSGKKEKIVFFTKHKRKDNSLYPVEVHLKLVEEANRKNFIAIILDITERKRAEASLLSTTERLRLATTSAKMGIYDWDIANDVLSWDDRMYEIYGVKKEDFKGALSAWQNGLHPDDFERANADLNDALEGKREFNSVFRVIWPDKSIHYIEGKAIVSRDSEGKALRMIGGNTDVTERKKAEEDILKANERFEKVTEATNDVIWDWDITTDKFYRSKAIEGLLGKSAMKSFSKKDFWQDSFHPEDKERLEKSVEEAIKDPKTTKWKEEYRLIDEKGELLYIVDQGVISRNKKGKATRMVGAMTDMTEHKLSEAENRFKANLLKNVGQAAIATNVEDVVTFWNKAAETIYGWTAEEAVGKSLDLLRPISLKDEQYDLKSLHQGRAWSGEFVAQKKSGLRMPVRASMTPFYDESDTVIGMIEISSDITQEAENKKLLKRYTRDLERSNEKLREIAWTQSHVVRAPLSRILGIVNLIELQEGKMDDILTWIEQLKISTNEMDEIVKKIVNDANDLD